MSIGNQSIVTVRFPQQPQCEPQLVHFKTLKFKFLWRKWKKKSISERAIIGFDHHLLSPSGHVFHTSWETMIKSYNKHQWKWTHFFWMIWNIKSYRVYCNIVFIVTMCDSVCDRCKCFDVFVFIPYCVSLTLLNIFIASAVCHIFLRQITILLEKRMYVIMHLIILWILPAVEQTVQLPVIWDAMALIWRHSTIDMCHFPVYRTTEKSWKDEKRPWVIWSCW